MKMQSSILLAAATDAPQTTSGDSNDLLQQARDSVSADKPAPAGDIPEDQIRAKVRAGMSRDQAITVIKAQLEQDAAAAKRKPKAAK